jgi:hypothetical protein
VIALPYEEDCDREGELTREQYDEIVNLAEWEPDVKLKLDSTIPLYEKECGRNNYRGRFFVPLPSVHSSHFNTEYPRNLVISATIRIFAVENRESRRRLSNSSELDCIRLARALQRQTDKIINHDKYEN